VRAGGDGGPRRDFLDPQVTLEVPHDGSRRVIEVRLDIQEFRVP
jgi:hypothetical protein